MTIEQKLNIETAKPGMANGISVQLHQKRLEFGENAQLTEEELLHIIDEAADHFGGFLSALGVDWMNDPNSADTPRRVAKAYVHDLWKGRFTPMTDVTHFPPDGYDGMVVETNIPLTSMCSHHHQLISGVVHIGYLPSGDSEVVGLSKLNRVVEQFGRRGAIQEQLTVAIHNAVDVLIPNNAGVAVVIDATHNCVSCRGVKHRGASMQTAKLSGEFYTSPSVKGEYYNHVNNSVHTRVLV